MTRTETECRRIQTSSVAGPALTIAYVVSGWLGLQLAVPPGYASAIFPPAGIALAAAMIAGTRVLPWIFLGSFTLNLGIGYSVNQGLNYIGFLTAGAIAAASSIQAALAGWLFRRVIGYPTALDQSQDLWRFLLLAPPLCLVSATLALSSLWSLGVVGGSGLMTSWMTWWIGDTLGVLVMLPLVFVLVGEPRTLWRAHFPWQFQPCCSLHCSCSFLFA